MQRAAACAVAVHGLGVSATHPSNASSSSPLQAGEAEQPRYEGEFKPALLQAWASSKSLPLVIKFG